MIPHGRPVDNGRYGGGKAGPEHRYSLPALDEAKWNEAKRGALSTSSWQGEAGEEIGAYVNTMAGTRGAIMGATYNCCWPTNGFLMSLPS